MDMLKNPVVVAGVVGAVGVAVFLYSILTQKKKKIALDPTKKIPFKLVKKENISHDTRRFTFALQSPEHILGLPIGQHMYLYANIGGKDISRAYTPVSSDDDVGVFVLVIKVYYPNERFPEGGKLSQYMDTLKIGDTMDVKGPLGKITYKSRGLFAHRESPDNTEMRPVKHIGMVAGGTGIAPMLQIITAVLKDKSDPTTLSLIFANQTEKDILVREELEACLTDPRFKLFYTLDRPTEGWKYGTGFVTADMIKAHLPPPGPDTQLLVCGPKPMVDYACIANFQKLGYDESMWLVF